MPAERVTSLLNTMTETDVALLTAAERERFVTLCERWARVARRIDEAPKVGVLYQLRTERAHG